MPSLAKVPTVALLTTLALAVAPTTGSAQTLLEADFSGMFSYSRSDFQSATGFNWGDAITGRFVWDNDLVPVTSTPYNIPLFELAVRLDPDDGVHSAVDLTEVGADQAFSQWQDGVFNGFAYSSPFPVGSSWYYLSIQGRVWTINGYDATTQTRDFTNYASGSLNPALTNLRAYNPDPPVGTVTPEPMSMALLGTGLAGLAALRWRRRKKDEELV